MHEKKEEVKKEQGTEKRVTSTCVCDNEFRGTHDNEWGDCVCTPDEQDTVKK